MTLLIAVGWLALGMTVPLSGTVEDADGRPVAGATVWLGDTIATRTGPEVLATAETDDQGRFRLERADDLAGRGGLWSPTLWAYRPGARVAFREFKSNLPGADEPVRLRLGPPAATALRVLQPDGSPAAGAKVRAVQLTLKAPRPPGPLLDRFAATADAEGRATLDGLRPGDILALDVTAEGQVVQCLPLDPETEVVQLRPLGRLEARLVADDPEALGGWAITARSRPTEPGYRGPYTTHWVRKTTGADGRVAFPPMAEGQVIWDIQAPEGFDYLVEKTPVATIRAGRTEAVEIPIRRGIPVEGTIREDPGGAPIPGVKVDLLALRSASGHLHGLATDDRGRFSALVLPGTFRFNYSYFNLPKEYFLPPAPQNWVDFEVKEGEERHEVTPPRLRKAVLVRGRVVDEAGEPVVGVDVSGSWTSAEFGRGSQTVRTRSEARGEFVLGSIAPGAGVRVTASAGYAAESEPVAVEAAGEGGPVTLRLRKKPTLALAGRVLGDAGRPLAGAVVRVQVRPPGQRTASGGSYTFEDQEEIRTGPDGRFRTPDQLPVGYEYRVEAEAPDYEVAGSGWLTGPEVAIPDVTLRRAVGLREVSGRVVDAAGWSIAGAEVVQSGDGPRRTRGTTDERGRFRVPAVLKAPALLFVSKEGYHFVGRRVDPGDGPVEIALRRRDEPATPLRAAPAPVARDEERAIARALLAEAKDAPGGMSEGAWRQQILEATALADPDRVVGMIENQVVRAEPNVLTALAVARWEDDPGRALEVLGAIASPSEAATATLSLFDRLGTAATPRFRRELLARAGRQAREIEEPGQAAGLLARVADRWLDLGDLDRGSALVREAQERAQRPRQQPFPDPRDDLATALARVDLPAALALLEGGDRQPYRLDTLRAGIATRVAATDPEGARRVLGAIDDTYRRGAARRVACLRMAATDLPTARALAAEDRDPMVAALLPAVAARARERIDLDEARALLRESVERLKALGDGPAGRPAPAVVLARLLPLAARLDPDRSAADLWLALSLRPPLAAHPERPPAFPEVRQHYLDLAELAARVGRYDHEAAGAVFAPVAARLAGLVDESWGLDREGPRIFQAAGTFDARAARALLDTLPDDPAPPPRRPGGPPSFRHTSKAQARIALARTLALPPALRLRERPSPPIGTDWIDSLDD